MCTGEVDRKVWMRLRAAGRIASAQRSISFGAARESPHTTAFLVRLAISWTASEIAFRGDREPGLDDVDAHLVEQSWQLPASRHGSWWRRGDCSPSRKVVSKITTRSLSDLVAVVMKFSVLRHRVRSFVGRSLGVCSVNSPECPGACAQPALRGS